MEPALFSFSCAAVRMRMVTSCRRAMVVEGRSLLLPPGPDRMAVRMRMFTSCGAMVANGRSLLLPPGPDRTGMMVVPAFTLTLTAHSHGVLHLGSGPPRAQGLANPVLPPPPHRRRRRGVPPGPPRRRGAPAVATEIGG